MMLKVKMDMFEHKLNFRFVSILLALAFASLCTFLLSGCSDEKKLQRIEKRNPQLFQPLVKDSVGKAKISYITHDSIIHLSPHTDTFTVDIPCPQSVIYTHVSHFKSTTASLQIDSGKATVICHDDSLSAVISWQNEIIDSTRTFIREGMAERLVAKPLSPFDNFSHWFTILVLLSIALYFGGKYVPALIKAVKGGI